MSRNLRAIALHCVTELRRAGLSNPLGTISVAEFAPCLFSFLKKDLFFFFWLCWVFVVVCRLSEVVSLLLWQSRGWGPPTSCFPSDHMAPSYLLSWFQQAGCPAAQPGEAKCPSPCPPWSKAQWSTPCFCEIAAPFPGTWAWKTKRARGSLHRCLPSYPEQFGKLKKEKFFLDLGPEPGPSLTFLPSNHHPPEPSSSPFPIFRLSQAHPGGTGNQALERAAPWGPQPALPLSMAFPSRKLWYLPS